jgi:MtN3 and saliva related transmembrane protein
MGSGQQRSWVRILAFIWLVILSRDCKGAVRSLFSSMLSAHCDSCKHMGRRYTLILAGIFLTSIILYGGEDLVPRDRSSLLIPTLQRSEIFGFVAGLGTTFAAIPDLFAMLRRRSSAGMNPRMAAILGVFQVLWVYYGLLIASRPVIAWNVIAIFINFVSVGAYHYFAGKEKRRGKRGLAA